MTARRLMLILFLGLREREDLVDDRAQLLLGDKGVHGLEHGAGTHLDAAQGQRFHQDRDRPDVSAGQHASQADIAALPGLQKCAPSRLEMGRPFSISDIQASYLNWNSRRTP